jgi:glycosyltransferase involved in cell wall biosynthesis
MRICIVTRVAPVHGVGGMQDHARDLALGLARLGHGVEVITSRHPEGVREETAEGVRWWFVDAPGEDFAGKAWRRRSWEAFARSNAQRPFDVVHSEGSSALELVRRGLHRRIPVVVEFHGNFLGLVKASLRRQLRSHRAAHILREQRGLARLARRHMAKGNWRLFRACEAIVPSAHQVADTCRSHLLRPERVHVVPNGVDTALFRPRPRTETRAELGLPDGLVFLCAGRLAADKGTHHALRALASLRQRGCDGRLVVVGDGEERERLERLARDLQLAEGVVFAGRQPPERMPLYFAAADVFLFPTERDEAAPLVLPQAMACGLPVIASAAGSVAEVVHRPGENGLLVPPGDIPALTDAMRILARDENVRRKLGSAARARVEEEYTLDRMVERTLAVYRLARGRLPPGGRS